MGCGEPLQRVTSAGWPPGGAVDTLVRLKEKGEIGHIGLDGGPLGLMDRYLDLGVFEVLVVHNRWTLEQMAVLCDEYDTDLALQRCSFRSRCGAARLRDRQCAARGGAVGDPRARRRGAADARRDGPGSYPLADGCQDHAIGLAIAAALASGEIVRVEREAGATPEV